MFLESDFNSDTELDKVKEQVCHGTHGRNESRVNINCHIELVSTRSWYRALCL